MFKIYKTEVENKLNRKIKAVRSDHGGGYYDRYDGLRNIQNHLPISERVWHCRLVHHVRNTSSE